MNEPLTSTAVTLSDDDVWTYTVGFLAAGSYTVAFTCQGSDDDPETDDDIVFVGEANVEILPGSATGHDF